MSEIHIQRSEKDIVSRGERLQHLRPDAVKAAFNYYFNLPEDLSAPVDYERSFQNDDRLDRMLLIDTDWEIVSHIEGEQPTYEGTEYAEIRRFLKIVQPKAGDVVYDLGAGYGRVVLMGAITHPKATFKGVELVSERVREANEIRDRLGLENAQFIHGNVRDVDLSDGNIFYMFNPFTSETLSIVMAKLGDVANHKRILLGSTYMFGRLDRITWLRELDPSAKKHDPSVLESSFPRLYFPEKLAELHITEVTLGLPDGELPEVLS